MPTNHKVWWFFWTLVYLKNYMEWLEKEIWKKWFVFTTQATEDKNEKENWWQNEINCMTFVCVFFNSFSSPFSKLWHEKRTFSLLVSIVKIFFCSISLSFSVKNDRKRRKTFAYEMEKREKKVCGQSQWKFFSSSWISRLFCGFSLASIKFFAHELNKKEEDFWNSFNSTWQKGKFRVSLRYFPLSLGKLNENQRKLWEGGDFWWILKTSFCFIVS